MPTLRTPAQFCDRGLAAADRLAELRAVAARYALALPQALEKLIDREDPHDPISRQFVPDAAELTHHPEELADPIGDEVNSPVEGIVHRYPDRVLFKLTHVCAVYCRFCFRREKVGSANAKSISAAAMARALDYIRSDPQIWEVILTGGDPLVLSSRRLRLIMGYLAAIDHVKVLRIHTRIPVAEPGLVTQDLVEAIRIKDKPTYVAVHVNHARELTQQARAACARLADAGMVLLGQSVLLKGVNDTPEALSDLLRACVETRIKPYYLHHCDLAPGTSHLRTDIATGQVLMRALRGRLSGVCQPTYVLDIPGGHGKSPIGPTYVESTRTLAGEDYVVQDFNGRRHLYPPAP
jgi:lysine 2,3-aminomutase